MRVLLTVPSLAPEFGGPAAKARQLAVALREHGADVVLAACGAGKGSTDPRTLTLPTVGGYHATPIPRTTARLQRLARTADVVHVLGLRDPVGTVAALAAVRFGVPSVIEPVGMHRRRLRSIRLKLVYDRTIGDRVIERAAVVVATSRLEADELVADGVASDRIALRPNGVDVTDLLPLPAVGTFRRFAGIPQGVPLVLSLGRITWKKGSLDLIDAVAGIDDVWLAVAGPDGGDGTLGRVRERLRAPDAARIRLIDRGMWGGDKAAAFTDADVFCLPSSTENFGNAAAEAAALGVPVVVSDECGVAEWLPQEMIRIVPFGDLDAIRGGIRELLSPDVVAKAKGLAEHVRLTLDWSSVATEQLAIYERAERSPTP